MRKSSRCGLTWTTPTEWLEHSVPMNASPTVAPSKSIPLQGAQRRETQQDKRPSTDRFRDSSSPGGGQRPRVSTATASPAPPDQMSVVVLLPLEQLVVPPPHEGVQAGPRGGGDGDLVPAGPHLRPHQSDEGLQGSVGLQTGGAVSRPTSTPARGTSALTMLTKLTISNILFLTASSSRFSFSY